jgi:hypothetical protein
MSTSKLFIEIPTNYVISVLTNYVIWVIVKW